MKKIVNKNVEVKIKVKNPINFGKNQSQNNKLKVDLKEDKKEFWSNFKNYKILISSLILIVLFIIIFFGQRFIFVAYVNGTPITRFAYYKALERKDGPTVLQNLIIKVLVSKEASKKGIVITNNDLQKAKFKIENQLKQQGQDLNSVLAQQGLTNSDFENQLKIQLTIEKLLGAKAKITDKEITDYINSNKSYLPANLQGNALKQAVKSQLQQQKLTQVFQLFIANLKKNSHITYFTSFK